MRSTSVVPRGELVASTTLGAMVIVKTTAQLYITHLDWIPEVDDVTAARLRARFAVGNITLIELARACGLHARIVENCVRGRGAFDHLPPVELEAPAYIDDAHARVCTGCWWCESVGRSAKRTSSS